MASKGQRVPNLDGLRAISIAVVFLFHAQIGGFGGGFLGVSLFFTLSGYLLGSTLAGGDLNLPQIGRYWVRRVRRLLPLAWAVLAAVICYELFAGEAPGDGRARLWWTAAGLNNWFQLAQDRSYANLFAAPDKLVHYWSLGIEQQVFLLLPVVLLGVQRLRRVEFRLWVVIGLTIVSLALPTLLQLSVERTYFGTDTRAGEILIGVALAMWHRTQRGLPDDERARPMRWSIRTGSLVAAASLAMMLVLVATARPGGAEVSRWLLPAQAVISVLLVHVASTTRWMWNGVLERRPLVLLGELSYAVYLVHWPVLVILDGWPVAARAVAGAVISVAISIPLVRFVERPFRAPSPRRMVRPGALVGAAALFLVMTVAMPVASASTFLKTLEADGAKLGAQRVAELSNSTTTVAPAPSTTVTGATDDATAPPTTTPPPRPVRVGIFGDSVALSLALLIAHNDPVDDLDLVGTATTLGCGLVTDLQGDLCADVESSWTDLLAEEEVDLGIIASCQWELIEVDIPGVGERVVGEEAYDRLVYEAYRDSIARLLDNGVAHVAWMLCPTLAQTVEIPNDRIYRDSRLPTRVEHLNNLVRLVALEFDERVTLIPVDEWMADKTEDATVRPDGSHFAYEEPTSLSDAMPELLAAAMDAAREARSA